MTRWLTPALVAWLVCGAAVAPLEAQARAAGPLAGRPLADALRELQTRGVRVVFSSELVRQHMRVVAEPKSTEPRAALEEILEPHGLEARPGPGATVLVVRARVRPSPPSREAFPAGGTIRGVVVDARSATPLPGVLLKLADTSHPESVSDADGRFEMTGVPAGRYTLLASLVGFTLARPGIELAAGSTADLTVALTDGTGTYTEQVTVTADQFRGTEGSVPSAMTLTGTDMLELRGVLSDDPLRAVQALPAAVAGNDFRSEFSVRGSDYRHIGLSVDGVVTDWPVHAVRDDASGGSVAILNSDIVDRVTLLSGAYPQDRPPRTGAWLDLGLREGSRARTGVRGGLSMTSASFVFEGPIGGSRPRGSWLIATRQSFVQWILARMGSDGSTAFGFSDAQGKAVYDVSPTQRLEITAVAGRSRLDLRRDDTDPNLVSDGRANAWMATAGWRWLQGDRLTLVQRVSAAGYGFDNARADGVPLADGSGHSAAYRGAVSWLARPSLLLELGGYAQRQSADQRLTTFIEKLDPAVTLPRHEVVAGSRVLGSIDARASHTSPGGFRLDGGLLLARAGGSAEGGSISPWLGAAIPLGSALVLRAAGGRYRQQPFLDQTASGTFGSAGVQSERATHLDVTLEYRWRADMRAQVTAFARRERDMLRLERDEYLMDQGAVVAPSLVPRWANALDGSSHGVEVLLQRRSPRGLSGWVAYTYGETDYQDRLTGERFAADFDQRHTFSLYAQHRLSPVTNVSAKLRVGSSLPIPGYLDDRGGALFVGASKNTVRLPAYARLDLRANRAFNFDTRRLTLFVEAVNVLARSNYAPGYESMRVLPGGAVTGATQKLFPFLPTAGILVEF